MQFIVFFRRKYKIIMKSVLRRRYILITPSKRSVARGRKEHPPSSELRSSSTPYGVVKERGDFSTPSCASLARGYQYMSPIGDENEQLSIKITLRKIHLYTNRYNFNTSCCILFVCELERSAKHLYLILE